MHVLWIMLSLELTLQFIFQTHGGGRQNIYQTYKFYELCFCNLIDEMHHH